MEGTKSLSKILHIRELEKHDAQKAYSYSQERFKDRATQLYTLLYKKEEAETSYEDYLQTLASIREIQEQLAYIEQLSVQILDLQQEVQKVRSDMENKQQSLTNAHVEVKKYERIIEMRWEQQKELTQKNEEKMMDSISTQQFFNRKNG